MFFLLLILVTGLAFWAGMTWARVPTPAPAPVPADIKKLVADSASASGQIKVPILMFHYVEYLQNKDDKTRLSLDTSPATFDLEVKTLADAGYSFLTAADLADVLDNKKALPERPVLLTFDDGYSDFYVDVYPILKKYHAAATQYVISGMIGAVDHMTAGEIAQIAADGLVEIGAHTVHHVGLRGLPSARSQTEILQSKWQLEQIINKRVVSFAYPYGSFDAQAISVVKASGFRTAVSTLPGLVQSPANRFFLFRLRPGGRVGKALLNLLDWKGEQSRGSQTFGPMGAE